MSGLRSVRTLAVVCPDWPLVAAGAAGVPAVVVHAGQVVCCSEEARAGGVAVGQRRREAEGLVYPLTVLRSDPALDARMFEPVVAAVAAFTPRVEVLQPGRCSFPTRGPARYFGGEQALAAKVAAAVDAVLAAAAGAAGAGAACATSPAAAGTAAGAGAAGGGVSVSRPETAPERSHLSPSRAGVSSSHTETAPNRSHLRCLVGIADGPFAALLAAEQRQLVERGRTRQFLAPFPVSVLGLPELADLLRRLGLRTLGELAGLPEEAVTARFGAEGREAWHLASGLDDRTLRLTEPPPDLAVARELDPPAARVDAAAFVAVGLADELCGRLRALELACTRIAVEVETEHGETLRRLWRADRPFTARTMVDRVRWQLEGWLAGTAGGGVEVAEPTGAVAVLRLAAEEVTRDRGRQQGLWGERSEADRRAEQGLARVQGLLGHAGVLTAVRHGGRSPAEQLRLVPWGDPRMPTAAAAAGAAAGGTGSFSCAQSAPERPRRPGKTAAAGAGAPPWPGSLPPPAPAVVLPEPRPVGVLDATGDEVRVSGRGELSSPPAQVGHAGVVAWAGPWPVDERWWDGAAHRRRAQLQVLVEGGAAHLLSLEGGQWKIEATYD